MAELFAKLSADVDVGGLVVDDTLAGQVRVRTYTPRQRDGLTAGVLYVHSGGFVVGSLDSEHSMAALIASRLGVAVVSVDYRLAPEHPYPAGLEDCHTAAPWLRANAARLGVDAERTGVYGNSAGAGLAASLTLLMRDRRDPPFCFQFLGVAQLDDRLDTPSMLRFVDTPLWSRPKAERSWRHYLGERAGDVPAYAAPARAADLSGLPPAYVSAMEFDPLRDEDVIYALRLLQAGVPVELHVYPGTFHGSALITTAAVTRRQNAEMLDALARGLRLSSAAGRGPT